MQIDYNRIQNKLMSCLITFLVGAFITCSSLCAYFYGNILLKQKVIENLVLKQDSEIFKHWTNPPANIYRRYYLFNVTNINDVATKRTRKPILVERGPYTYREDITKTDVKFLPNNKISYKPVSRLYFEPSLSNGTENDMFNFLNIPLVAAIDILSQSEKFKRLSNILFDLSGTQKLFLTKSVHQIISGFNSDLTQLGDMVGPRKYIYKFGLANQENGTTFHEYIVSNGADNIANVGQIESWNNLTKLNYYSSKKANCINGSDGGSFPPFLKRDQKLFMFNPEMCRSLRFEYLKDSNVEGIDTFDFNLPKDIFYNSSAENEGFCTGDECIGNGVHSISKCREGVPMYVSLPHFLNAEEKFVKSVNGLRPDENKHDYVLSLDATTGSVIDANIRIQLNYNLKRSKSFDLTKKIKSVLLPIFWLEMKVQPNENIFNNLKTLQLATRLITILPLLMIGIGIALLTSTFVLLCLNIVFKSHSFKDKYNLSEASILSTEQSITTEKILL